MPDREHCELEIEAEERLVTQGQHEMRILLAVLHREGTSTYTWIVRVICNRSYQKRCCDVQEWVIRQLNLALKRILEEREEASNLNMSILKLIKLITRNFSEKYKIGHGGWI